MRTGLERYIETRGIYTENDVPRQPDYYISELCAAVPMCAPKTFRYPTLSKLSEDALLTKDKLAAILIVGLVETTELVDYK